MIDTAEPGRRSRRPPAKKAAAEQGGAQEDGGGEQGIEQPGGQIVLIHRQSCSGPHERQVFAVFDDPAPSSADYPGSDMLLTTGPKAPSVPTT